MKTVSGKVVEHSLASPNYPCKIIGGGRPLLSEILLEKALLGRRHWPTSVPVRDPDPVFRLQTETQQRSNEDRVNAVGLSHRPCRGNNSRVYIRRAPVLPVAASSVRPTGNGSGTLRFVVRQSLWLMRAVMKGMVVIIVFYYDRKCPNRVKNKTSPSLYLSHNLRLLRAQTLVLSAAGLMSRMSENSRLLSQGLFSLRYRFIDSRSVLRYFTAFP